MAMATRVVGEEEGKVGKGDGDGNEEMATRRQREDDETTTRQQRDDDEMTTRCDDDETTMRRHDDDVMTTRRCWRTEEATDGTWMDSIGGPIIQRAVQKQQGFGVNM
jgi:hypothetical protein